MTIRLGLLLSGGSGPDPAELADGSVRLTRAARDAGFRVVVAGQHFLTAPNTYLQPVPLLARLVPESGTMSLGTGVLLLPLLHPIQVAEDLASLDVLSGGRLLVGVGQGYRDHEFEAFGVDRGERLQRQLESLDLIEALWRGGSVAHQGVHYPVTTDGAAMHPLQRPRPPIWYAASSQRTVRRALQRGYVPYLGPQVARSVVDELLQGAELPSSEVALRRDVLVREVVDDDTIASCIAARDARYSSWGYRKDDGDQSPRDRDPYVVGTVAECRDLLNGYGALGVGTVVLRTTWPGLPFEASVEMVRAMGDAVTGAGEDG